MKWSKEQEQQLKELCFEEKSNKEIAAIMGIKLSDVHAARSRLGVTMDKVRVAKIAAENGQPVTDQKVKRTIEEIDQEIIKVEKAHETAKKKVERCTARLEVLYEELVKAHES